MNREQIETRIKEITVVETNAQQQLVNAQRTLDACLGAREDCQYWLAKTEVAPEIPSAVAVANDTLATVNDSEENPPQGD